MRAIAEKHLALIFFSFVFNFMTKLENYINETFSLEDEYYLLFNRRLPSGKFSCPNPLHQHTNHTPSCKVYDNKFKCFGQCNRMFGVYDLWKWYSPERINEVKASTIIASNTESNRNKIHKVTVDKSQPIHIILQRICKSLNL